MRDFTTFLVGRDGRVVEHDAPTTKPETLRADIEKVPGREAGRGI
jgi:glutathione peroxidase-family protein